MSRVRACAVPAEAFLADPARCGAYTDAYAVEVAAPVSLADFVTAFYTTPLFRMERAILRWVVARPSTDAEARRLAMGEGSRFAAWDVERRDDRQLLLTDLHGRTRSWLQVTPVDGGTRLYFGSAVLPQRRRDDGTAVMGWGFNALLGFHRLYSVLLLRSAVARLRRRREP